MEAEKKDKLHLDEEKGIELESKANEQEKENKKDIMKTEEERIKKEEDKEKEKEEKPKKPENFSLTVQNYVKLNGEMTELYKKRGDVLGFFKYIELLIFLYLLISPLFPIFVDLNDRGWVLALVILPLILLIWSFIEYYKRQECWFICICRGIILDLEKTFKPVQIFCTLPLLFVYLFMLIMAVLYATSYQPQTDACGKIVETNSTDTNSTTTATTTTDDEDDNEWKRYSKAVLFLLGIVFIVSLTKAFVDLEAAPKTLSMNLFIFLHGDKSILEDRGYKVVHFSQLKKFMDEHEKTPDNKFSWNDIFKLSAEPDPEGISKYNLSWGISMAGTLAKYKDLNE